MTTARRYVKPLARRGAARDLAEQVCCATGASFESCDLAVDWWVSQDLHDMCVAVRALASCVKVSTFPEGADREALRCLVARGLREVRAYDRSERARYATFAEVES
jgi:hypothetical protein